ncbi:MAG: hypothetical protein CVV14_07450 [Gammaproteobacteria bacterium HGW-Gammaproteobacteria-4]|nr:MAG: hypothetical protein CVV14_07450 [Gammaproteobacteria bacterium HGW-Gammaproteobacteria-4]
MVAGAVTAIALTAGLWLLVSIYLYWQWFHYARQSEGISKAYAGRSRGKDIGDSRLTRLMFYSVPIAGILAVSARQPQEFLLMPVKTFPVPHWLAFAAIIVAAVLCFAWLVMQIRAFKRGRLAVPYVAYMTSHFVMFAFAYLWLAEINYGWLAINMWHNAQYILFVWLFNNRRFNGAIDPERVFLSTISQNGRFALYIGVCLTLSTFIYFLVQHIGIDALSRSLGVSVTAAAIIIYQTLNFHHYVVDAVVWKLRKPKLRNNLGLS